MFGHAGSSLFHQLFLVVVSRGFSLAVMHTLLTVWPHLLWAQALGTWTEHRLHSCGAQA